MVPKNKECSMCGDVGFEKDLFRCTSCEKRYQHRYCSRLYPSRLPDRAHWLCDWCIPKQSCTQYREELDKLGVDRSPLDCLLEAVENVARNGGEIPKIVKKKDREGYPEWHMQRNQPMVPRKKRCTELKIPTKQEKENDRFKAGQGNIDASRPSTSSNLQFSPSKGIVGKRYRLLSEVLC